MIEYRDYERGDVLKIELKKLYECYNIDKNIIDASCDSKAFLRPKTIFNVESGEVIAVVGMSLIWKGVATIWAYIGESVSKYKKSFIQIVMSLLFESVCVLDLHRVDVHCPDGDCSLTRWFEYLGFKKDCLLQKYLPNGQDAFLYSRCF
jgi:hypothetical protein